MAKLLSTLPVGSVVKSLNTKYNNSVIRFIVGHQATGRTKLVTERMITLKCFDAKESSNPNSSRATDGNNRYSQSNIDQWLNSTSGAGAWYSARHAYDAPPNNANVYSGYNEYDAQAGFLSFFEESFRNAILDSTIRVVKNTVTDGGGYEDITRKVYLLSNTEVGLANENGIAEGVLWDYFNSASRRQCYPTAEAVSASEYTSASLSSTQYWYWWLRTPSSVYSYIARRVSTNGSLDLSSAYRGTRGVRPALEVSSSMLVSDSVDTDGAYIIQWNQPPTTPLINTPTNLVAGQLKTISWSASTDPNGNTITYKLERAINGSSTFSQIYSGSATSYTDTLGSWTQVQYRVKATNGIADSAYSTTAVLSVAQLCVPTATAPINASKINVKVPNTFTFTGSKTFTHYEIQYRKGTDPWTSTGQIASSTGSHTFAANTFVGVGDPVYEYQIQLKDTETGLWSGWTTSYTFTAFQPYATTGTYESAPFNHGKEFLTGTLTWSATVPAGTSLTGYYATSSNGITWGAWTSATSGMTIPAGTTWIKTKFDLTPSADGLTTPSIASISIYYDDQYYDEGTWYSPVMDISKAVTTFADILTSNNVTLNGGTISYYTRHRSLPTDAWSDWEAWGSGTTTVNNYMQLKVVLTPEATRATSPMVTGLKYTFQNDTKKSMWLSQPIDVSLAKDMSNSKAIADSLYHGGQIVMYSRSKASLGGTWTAWSLALEDGTLTHTPNVYVQIMLVLINNAEVRELTLSLDGDASVEVIKSGMTPGATYSFTILDDLAVMVNGNDQPLKWNLIDPPSVLNADPPILSMVLTHHNRAWGVDSEMQSRLRFSNILDPTVWDAYDFIDFNPDDGDQITAIVRYGQNLVVSKQRSMALLTGNRSTNYNVSWLDSESGATGANAICIADKYMVYVAQDGIRFTDLAQSVIATERLNPSWERINKRRLNQAALVYWKNRLFAALPSEGSLHNDTVWVYDFLRNSWSIIDGWEVSTWKKFNQYGEDVLLAGSSIIGQLYHVDVTSYDDTIPVELEWRSKDFNFKTPEKYKLFRNVFLDIEGVSETTNLYVDLIVDGIVKGTYNTVIPAGDGIKHTRRILPPIYGAVLGSSFGLRIRGRCGIQSITIEYAIRGNIPGGEL